jgi:hypothetical protein
MERQGDRDFVDAGTAYRPRADVTIRAATLVAAQNVWLANAVVVPNPKVPIGAYLRGWPLPSRVLHRDFPRWAERRPLVGATLRAGTSYAVLLHVRALGRRTEGGYRAVRLRYDADGTRYRTELPVELRLRRSC